MQWFPAYLVARRFPDLWIGSIRARLLAAAVLLGPIAPAVAQSSEPLPAGSQSDYDAILKQAVQEFQLGNWDEARSLFERAHELRPSARTSRAMGLAAFESKSYAAAVVDLRAALEDQRRPLTTDQRVEVQVALERSLGYVAQCELELIPGHAAVRVDAHPALVVESRILLDPGDHRVTATAEGYAQYETTIVARPRDRLHVRIELSPLGRPSAAPVASAVNHEPQDGLSTLQILGIGAAGLGAVGLGIGTYFGLHAMSQDSDSGCADGLCPDTAAKELNDDALSSAQMATPFFIAGATTIVAGAVMLFWPVSNEENDATGASGALGVAPKLSTREAGLTIAGRF